MDFGLLTPPGQDNPPNAARTTGRGYYGLPVLKAPVWRWEIWSYFFLGGLAAGSYLVATLAELAGDAKDRAISRVGTVITCVALLLCPPLLIKDLGRPERFLNMLRVFKPESPMSLGVWGLLGFTVCAFATLSQDVVGQSSSVARLLRLILPRRPLILIGSALATFVGGYTGVLLSVSSVPLWSRSRLLGPTFFASALSSGASAIALIVSLSRSDSTSSLHKVERVKLLAAVAELLAVIGFLRQTDWAAGPLIESRYHGRAFLGGAVGLGAVAPIVIGLAPFADGRRWTVFRSVCAIIGGVCLRYALIEGGRRSADDPEATFRHADRSDGLRPT